MAEYCIKCNKKIGFWEDPGFCFTDATMLCRQCAQPVNEFINRLDNSTPAESKLLEDELRKVCASIYDDDFVSTFVNYFHKKRTEMNLLTDAEKEDKIRKAAEKDKQQLELEQLIKDLPMTTTNNFEGYKIKKYVKVVSEELIFKNSIWKRLDAGLEDLGNTFSFKQTEMSGASEMIANAREYTLEKFKRKVAKLGANAAVGVEFESSLGSDIVRVAIFGTAVIIEKDTTY